MTKCYAIFMILFVSAAVCLVGCLPLWKVPEGLSRWDYVSLPWFLLELHFQVFGDGRKYYFFRCYGEGILLTSATWAASFLVGHICYLALFGQAMIRQPVSPKPQVRA
jgi:hypothetical protein